MSNRFSIGEREFSLSKINAIQQYHIVRRLAPVLAELLPVAQKYGKMTPEQLDSRVAEDSLGDLAPVLNGIAKLSDADSNKILYGLLAAVQVKQGQGNWANVSSGEQLMFQDMELPVLLQVAGRALMFNLSGFFATLPQVTRGK
jgi:hypothetical protein